MDSELVGRTLGDFQVEALVGSGSMARVYEARQISLRRKVALKVLQEGLFTPGENVRRFLREAEALARLEHANIVPVYAAGTDASYYFFAMRLVRGGTLDDAMRSGLKRATALHWAVQICQALAYAHESGVIHRDLKPTNVLIQDGMALLSDFGLARLRDVSTITQPGHILGTPLYMSPEQTCGETVGPGADCFALGVLMYQMLTGRHPFAHPIPRMLPTQERRTRLFRAIQDARCDPPSMYDEKIPPPLDELIMRALARQPQDRHKDGPAMLEALTQIVRQVPEDDCVIQYDLRSEDPHTSVAPQIDMLSSTATSHVLAGNASSSAPFSVGAPNVEVASPLSKTGDTTHSDAAVQSASAQKQDKPQGVLGRYNLIKQIGHGGQGIVYQAHDAVLDRTVALKVLRKDVLTENNLDELFWHEARVAARLNHPHIITIYDFGIEDKQPYITMQLIDGPSLDRLLESQKPVPLSFALQVLIQAADGIGFAHEAGIVHLDLKPGNILIRGTLRGSGESADEHIRKLGRPHVILSDFTMARISRAAKMERQFTDGSMAGTLAYAAPEQLDGKGEIGPVSDLFALGVVFYEMLTGSRLFCSDNPIVSRELILSGVAPRPSSKVPSIPPQVDELCARLICRSSQQRIQSAPELIAAAEKLLPLCEL